MTAVRVNLNNKIAGRAAKQWAINHYKAPFSWGELQTRLIIMCTWGSNDSSCRIVFSLFHLIYCYDNENENSCSVKSQCIVVSFITLITHLPACLNDMKRSHHGKNIEELPRVEVEESTNIWKNLFLIWWVGWVETDKKLIHLRCTRKDTALAQKQSA